LNPLVIVLLGLVELLLLQLHLLLLVSLRDFKLLGVLLCLALLAVLLLLHRLLLERILLVGLSGRLSHPRFGRRNLSARLIRLQEVLRRVSGLNPRNNAICHISPS